MQNSRILKTESKLVSAEVIVCGAYELMDFTECFPGGILHDNNDSQNLLSN